MTVKKADVLAHDFVECLMGTGLGHVWEPCLDDGRRYKAYPNTTRYRRKSRICVRCKTQKSGVWDRITGDMHKPWAYYNYPKGYHLPGRLDGRILRKAYLEMFKE